MEFYKYHGAGNDFILIDNRSRDKSLDKEQVAFLCDRHLGIGADGLMLLEPEAGYDFRMVYYNADGNESSMCGNGGRCITEFARSLGIVESTASFIAIDGAHRATIQANGLINLGMGDVQHIDYREDHVLLNTGSPHYIVWVDDVVSVDVYSMGSEIRYRPDFMPDGINVNFVQRVNDNLLVRTYERGVEDETLSCGTGVTAAAIAASGTKTGDFVTQIETPGGHLEVSFSKPSATTATNVVLTGPAVFVYKGIV